MRISDWSSDVCSSDLVANARIEGNSLIDVARITLAAGADAERSAPPVDSKFERNLIVGAKGHDPFRAEGEIGGIALADNVQAKVAKPLMGTGVEHREIPLESAANAPPSNQRSYV